MGILTLLRGTLMKGVDSARPALSWKSRTLSYKSCSFWDIGEEDFDLDLGHRHYSRIWWKWNISIKNIFSNNAISMLTWKKHRPLQIRLHILNVSCHSQRNVGRRTDTNCLLKKQTNPKKQLAWRHTDTYNLLKDTGMAPTARHKDYRILYSS